MWYLFKSRKVLSLAHMFITNCMSVSSLLNEANTTCIKDVIALIKAATTRLCGMFSGLYSNLRTDNIPGVMYLFSTRNGSSQI